MKIGAIIQARMGSTRLPGKVLKRLGDKSVLEHVYERVAQAKTLDTVIIATTERESDDVIVELAEQRGWPIYRGAEEEVLVRYYQTSKHFDLDAVVRITADCPLIDPMIIDELVTMY